MSFSHVTSALPWMAGSYVLYQALPPRIQRYTSHLPTYLHLHSCFLFSLPKPFSNVGLGLGIANECQKFRQYSKKLAQASDWSDRLKFFAMTYVTCKTAYDYFYQMADSEAHEKGKVSLTATFYSRAFTIGLIGATLALQFKYALLPTLTGLVVGALVKEVCHTLTMEKIGALLSLREKDEILGLQLYDTVHQHYTEIKQINSSKVISLTSMQQKCWTAWNRAALSIANPLSGFTSGIFQGMELHALFRD